MVFPLMVLLAIGCSQKSPEEKAMNLVIKSNVLRGDQNVGTVINDFIYERGDEVKPIGWEVTKNQNRIYLVKYRYEIHSYQEGIGERGFFFEVDLDTELVLNVTPLYVRKMEPLASPYKDEKKLVEGLIKDNLSNLE